MAGHAMKAFFKIVVFFISTVDDRLTDIIVMSGTATTAVIDSL